MIVVGIYRVGKVVFVDICRFEKRIDDMLIISTPFYSLCLVNNTEELIEAETVVAFVEHIGKEVMKIARTSPITGQRNTLEVNCTQEQLAAWEAGMLIQDAMPDVPAPLREFLMSGTTPEEWIETSGLPPCSSCCQTQRDALW